MKKQFTILLMLMLAALLSAGKISLQSQAAQAEILRSTSEGLSLRFAIDSFEYQNIESKEGVFSRLSAATFSTTNKVGDPALPLLRRIISVPLGATLKYTVRSEARKSVSLSEAGVHYPLMPYQESVSKSADMENLPFVVNRDFYNGKKSTQEATIQLSELGMMRGERLVAIDYVPANYNPATKTLDVVYRLDVDIVFENADYAATNLLKAKTQSVAFDTAFGASIWNYNSNRSNVFLRHPTGYVIITPQSFIPALQPFIDWKRQEGYLLTIATIESIGNSTTNIKNYMQSLWNAATPENPAPSYLLIVGDVAQVVSNNGSTGSHPTDLNYVRLEGTDYMPEMYFGRFSATTPAEVTNQVNKTLMHERYTMPDDSYLANPVMIAGVDSYWASSHGNGQINYATQNYFNNAHGITPYTYLYPASGSSASQIVGNVSAGSGYVNYTAHGDVTYWHDPRFDIANINSLQNYNKYSFVVGNCCLTSKFDYGVCFAEAWLRAENKGAIIYIGGTNSTYWDEDYWWGVGFKGSATGNAPAYNANTLGVYDALFHDHNEPFAKWANSAGAMTVTGNLAVVQGNSSRINYYWEIYSIMGDPSLTPYLGIPANNSFVAPETIFLGMGNLEINADPYTYVAISMNNELHGVGITDENGYLNLEYVPFVEPGTAQIVLTRSMRKPMIANVNVIPNDGPYVTVGLLGFDDDNGIAEAGESLPLNLSFNNVGILPAENLSVSVESQSPWVYFDTKVQQIENIPADTQVNIEGLFVANIDQGVPDQHRAGITFSVSDGSNTWDTTRYLDISAPNVIIASTSFFDPNNNGAFEPGETINITINITNNGHMPVESGSLKLIMNSDTASLLADHFTIPGINVGVNIPISLYLTISPEAEEGSVIPLGVALDMGAQMINHSIMVPVGATMEGFESGNFGSHPWVNNSPIPWTISSDAYSGSYSARSGAIGNNANTSLSITMDVSTDSEIRFYRKVSSENNYDFLRFYIDDSQVGAWSGNQSWAEVSFPVVAGTRTFKWSYIKDISVASGSDAAWIDNISFPASGDGNIPLLYTGTDAIHFNEVLPNSTVSQNLVIRNLGAGTLSGMISIPAGFSLYSMGEYLPNDSAFDIAAAESKIYVISYQAGETVNDINDVIYIASNDPDLPELNITLTLRGATSNSDMLNPVITALKGNYPNPFNPETTIRFSLKDAGKVRISVYNLKGQMVKKVLERELDSGYHSVVWDGRDERGKAVASGIYFYRMENGSFVANRKMMLMK